MTRPLMVVGTASHAGKSIFVTALCRILKQDGLRVAPFKSQNMALNSFVCKDGSEIGRAQVAQAEAAGIEPEADMNPILLKPAGNTQVQVVLHGRVHGTMTAAKYYEQKPFFFKKALESFHRLQAKFDAIVLEGAGSPVELNLKDRDIVNLPFARAVGARALLVADIDRGGVFASVIGTFHLLEKEEREILRGFVINRFRGDLSLFRDGPALLEQHTQRPCYGVLPYLQSLRIDQEDSLSLEGRTTSSGRFRIGVIRLPHISNYTDFNALEAIPGIAVEYLLAPSTPVDFLIIPGTKNTIRDLRWLRENGFERFIQDHVARQGWILGICGGYQMMGVQINDPFRVEEGGSIQGLQLLPAQTELGREKITVQSQGTSFLGQSVSGYEIHMGKTESLYNNECFIHKSDGTDDGLISGHVAGTYFHGIFDNPEFAKEFLSRVAQDCGIAWHAEPLTYSKENEYDRLAQTVREHVDLKRICELMQ